MKRQFNVFDGLFLMALTFKLTGIGPSLSWMEVFTPYFVEAFLGGLIALLTLFSVWERLKYKLWSWAVKLRIKAAGKKAKKIVNEAIKRTANPGQFIDPSNKGK